MTRNQCETEVSARPLQGFTLVELQIALLLLTMITLIMVSTLRNSSLTWGKLSERQLDTEHHHLVSELLKRQLSNARFRKVRTKGNQSVISFFADEEFIHFVAPFPSYQQDNDLYWWTLISRSGEEKKGHALVLQFRPFDAEQIVSYELDGSLTLEGAYLDPSDRIGYFEDIEPEELVVAENVKIDSFKFLQFDRYRNEDWRESWEPGKETPKAIVVQLAKADRSNNSQEANPWYEIAAIPKYARRRILGVGDD